MALDPADQTLWTSFHGTFTPGGDFYLAQYSKSGALLSSQIYPALSSSTDCSPATGTVCPAFDVIGMEFAFTASEDHPPDANSQSISTPGNMPIPITLTASDADNDPLTLVIANPPAHGKLTGAPSNVTYTPNPNYIGADIFTFTANDGKLSSSPGFVTITVFDNTRPVIVPTTIPPPDANGWNNASVTVSWSVTDPESGIATSTGCGPRTLKANTAGTTLTCKATNGAGLSSKSSSRTIKIDQTPPAISGMPARGCTLSPANHQMVQVAVVTAVDALSGVGSWNVTAASNQPDSGTGPRDLPGDIAINDGVVQLRTERSPGLGTRIYTITAVATDVAGNSKTATATCRVAK